MTRLREGDTVVVLTGVDRGKTGRLLSIDRGKDKVVVEGVNMKWKHVRKSQESPQGGRIQREYPLNASNVAYWDAEAGKGVRLGATRDAGKLVRVSRPSGRAVDA
ncbi:MAG: 50S ribosomal protein L24 [Planctomycetota bacterium]|jgi:large subunit ribosomal protein L24